MMRMMNHEAVRSDHYNRDMQGTEDVRNDVPDEQEHKDGRKMDTIVHLIKRTIRSADG
jgi:hypothetical protein